MAVVDDVTATISFVSWRHADTPDAKEWLPSFRALRTSFVAFETI